MGEFWDVIVIGGGPAGSSAAYRIAQSGAKVLVLEKSEMPRDKVCGGALSPAAVSFLDFSLPENIVDMYCRRVRIFRNGTPIDVEDEHPIAVFVTRSVFDSYLLERARDEGARVVFGKAEALSVGEESVSVKTGSEIHSGRMAIIAAGASSRLVWHVRRKDRPHERGLSLKQDISCIETDPFADMKGSMNIYFNIGRHAYSWVFHHGTYCSVSIGGRLDMLKDPRGIMEKFWGELGLPADKLDPKGCIIPFGGYRRELVSERIMLAGDSAGFADPFTGEGIAWAIRSGQTAAEVAAGACESGDFTRRSLSVYSGLCRKRFGSNLRNALIFARAVNMFPRLISDSSDMLRKFLSVTRNELSYSRYMTWLIPRLPGAAVQYLMGRKK